MAFGDTAPPLLANATKSTITVNIPTTRIAYTVLLLFSERK